jgi:hypothetical protein
MPMANDEHENLDTVLDRLERPDDQAPERPDRADYESPTVAGLEPGRRPKHLPICAACLQATRAADNSIRAAMQRIARDERRHAVLAWRIATWVERRVDYRSRARIATVRRDAFGHLLTALDEPSAEMVQTLGLPTRTQSLALAQNLLPLISRTV